LIKLKQINHGVVVSEIDVGEGDLTIGRNHGNSLQLDDDVVSGEHALLKLEQNPYMSEVFDISIRDLGSTNGTYVNNTSVKENKLKHGDLIRIGSYEYKVFDDQSTDSTNTAFYVPDK
jgi:pSer/pThr/pTyr-binding forkhead associated (FHA) protein